MQVRPRRREVNPTRRDFLDPDRGPELQRTDRSTRVPWRTSGRKGLPLPIKAVSREKGDITDQADIRTALVIRRQDDKIQPSLEDKVADIASTPTAEEVLKQTQLGKHGPQRQHPLSRPRDSGGKQIVRRIFRRTNNTSRNSAASKRREKRKTRQ